MATRRALALAAGAAMLWAGFSARAQSEDRFQARLTTVPVDFVNRALVTGAGSATAVLAATKLSINGTFEGLSSPATVARLHNGRQRTGVRGPSVFELTVTQSTTGTISGSFDLKPDQVEALKQGRFYIQLHSQKAPDGNLWGWLLKPER